MAKEDFDAAVAEIRAASNQGLEGLRSVRALLVDPAFSQQLRQIVARAHNAPEEQAAMSATLAQIKFSFLDRLAERSEQHAQTSVVAIGGGTAVATGALLAITTQILVFPWLAVVPLALGTYFGLAGMATNRRLALEKSALNDIVQMLDEHIRGVSGRD